MAEVVARTAETVVQVGETPVTVLKGGDGPPLLVLHDELGYPGWMSWNDRLAASHELIVPLQPGYGRTPRVDWIRSYRDLGGFYALLVHGTDDLIAPRGCVAAYEAAIPTTTTVEIPGAGHRPEIEDPDAFLAAVTNFLGV